MTTNAEQDHGSGETQNTIRKPGHLFRLRAVAVCLSVFAAMALVESAFRVFRPTPWYLRVEQSPEVYFADGTFTTIGETRFHLREKLETTPKADDVYRILFLGDSFTFGSGLDDLSAAFVDRIEDRLNRDYPRPDIARYEVYNGGQPGSYTDKWVILLDYFAERFDPALVVTVFFLRDGAPNQMTTGLLGAIKRNMRQLSRRGPFLYRYSHAYRFFRDRVELERLSRKHLGAYQEAYLGSSQETRIWRRARANLRDLRDLTERLGARFAMVIFPVLYELDDDYPFKGICEGIERFCRQSDIEVLSLLPTYLYEDGPSLWVSSHDQHPNARGHALAADAIYEYIEPMIRVRGDE